jgi:hypothetical protein
MASREQLSRRIIGQNPDPMQAQNTIAASAYNKVRYPFFKQI